MNPVTKLELFHLYKMSAKTSCDSTRQSRKTQKSNDDEGDDDGDDDDGNCEESRGNPSF